MPVEAADGRSLTPRLSNRTVARHAPPVDGRGQSKGPHRLNGPRLASPHVKPYFATARAFRWVLVAIVALVWGAGLFDAAAVYGSTYRSAATIWAVRAAPALSVTDPDDPNIALIPTAAAQQAEVLKQFVPTRSVLIDVTG